MPLELSHIGEELVARLFRDIYRQGKLAEVRCTEPAVSFADDVRGEGMLEPLEFLPKKAGLKVVTCSGDRYDCDGMQKADILCAGDSTGGHVSIAIEAKLGEALLSPTPFKQRFCGDCTVSGHKDKRVRGNMVALLDRRFDASFPDVERIEADNTTVSLHWWLVMRKSVTEQWSGEDRRALAARIVALEDLILLYGPDRLDDLVLEIAGKGFGEKWTLWLS